MFVTQITGVMKQIVDVAHQVIEDSTTHVHAVRELIIWVTVQVRVLLFPRSLKGLQAYIAKFEKFSTTWLTFGYKIDHRAIEPLLKEYGSLRLVTCQSFLGSQVSSRFGSVNIAHMLVRPLYTLSELWGHITSYVSFEKDSDSLVKMVENEATRVSTCCTIWVKRSPVCDLNQLLICQHCWRNVLQKDFFLAYLFVKFEIIISVIWGKQGRRCAKFMFSSITPVPRSVTLKTLQCASVAFYNWWRLGWTIYTTRGVVISNGVWALKSDYIYQTVLRIYEVRSLIIFKTDDTLLRSLQKIAEKTQHTVSPTPYNVTWSTLARQCCE